MLYPHGSKRWSCKVAFGRTLLIPDREETSSAVCICQTSQQNEQTKKVNHSNIYSNPKPNARLFSATTAAAAVAIVQAEKKKKNGWWRWLVAECCEGMGVPVHHKRVSSLPGLVALGQYQSINHQTQAGDEPDSRSGVSRRPKTI